MVRNPLVESVNHHLNSKSKSRWQENPLLYSIILIIIFYHNTFILSYYLYRIAEWQGPVQALHCTSTHQKPRIWPCDQLSPVDINLPCQRDLLRQSILFPIKPWRLVAFSTWIDCDLWLQEIVFVLYSSFNMGVSKNMGTPKCMVYNGKPY